MVALTRKTDYALVALAYLARWEQGCVSARDIAARVRIPLPMLMGILNQLARRGLVISTRGAKGGYRLARERRFRRPLDMGCGSGILSLAMAKTWRAPVVACDIDDEAVRVTTANAARNGVARGRPYDLIVANILARPLHAMAGELTRALAPGGIAVLSGLLMRDACFVIAPHRAHGLRLIRTLAIGDWVTLILGK